MDDRGNFGARASGAAAVQAQTEIVIAHIRARTLIKFGLYGLAALFVIVAALLIVFAPEGRETATTIVAIGLFALAAGSAGFGAFAIKTPLVSAQAGEMGSGRASLGPNDPDSTMC